MSPFTSMLSSFLRKSQNEGILVQNVLKMILYRKRKFNTAWKVSVFRVFLVRIFQDSDWIRRDTDARKSGCGKIHFSRKVIFTRISCYHFQTEWIISQANFNLRILSRRVGVHSPVRRLRHTLHAGLQSLWNEGKQKAFIIYLVVFPTQYI